MRSLINHESFPFVILSVLLIALFSTLTVIGYASSPDPALIETRYCGEPKRNLAGEIIRRSAVRDAFQRIHPCPSTGLQKGPCPRYKRNHPIPLACGGCDSVSNMEWMRDDAKKLHDSYERKIYGGRIDTPSCLPVPEGGIK